ncbi:MAG: 30S ribosomal protein S9 [Candidatus Peribacteraceae bacterium]|jgi:small subunit ribosomal protein S9|nr:30S ribosomal protein S9 [Candidatus Peribacteraceae bacterium]HCI03388.1 30S ribosomal protein S9 [Candidatus Peribacteria bacterium]|tara:strand:- start:7053 stop:7463 length:411 start_codon:yes stop_codon:yes gene_type:complete
MTAATSSKKQYHYAAGKRKTAIARVKLFEGGKGDLKVNGKDAKEYFTRIQRENALAPLALTDNTKTFDIEASVKGGGKSAQSDAIRHGISKGLTLFGPDFRPTLKKEGYLRRDARIKERKKPGLKRARKSPQWAKR